jgi:UDP-N-acetylmuramoyl-tripeptide--D-alanyl-D-alanine ligase
VIQLDVEELAPLGLGELHGSGRINGLHIDSRRVGPGDLFVAVRGGRDFVADARDRGAHTLVPNDAFDALAAIGQAIRSRSLARFVGVTGSTGKTSTKDILAALCAPVARTVATEASYNAELGVPLTLGRLEHDTELCIVEMGMRGFGQIAALCEIVRPHAAVISAVGPVHLELVGSVDGVARSKAELVDALPGDGVAVVPESPDLEPYLRDDVEIRRVGPVDVELREDGAHVAFAGRRIRFPLTSRHQAQNALTALTAYEALGLPLDRVDEGAANVRLSRSRGEELPLPGGGFVVDDAYNANPTSMEAALRHLAERGNGRRLLAILGGMAELGEHAERHHREIAELAGELGIELLAVGDLARDYGSRSWVPDADAALRAARERVRPGDAVLVKASRAVALEGIAAALANDGDRWSES